MVLIEEKISKRTLMTLLSYFKNKVDFISPFTKLTSDMIAANLFTVYILLITREFLSFFTCECVELNLRRVDH